MINNNSNALSIIKETVERIVPGSRVLLFGSRTRCDNSSDSDYDFLVITKETIDIRRKRILKSLMRKELAAYKIPADILLESEIELSLKKQIVGHIIRQIVQDGVEL